MEQQNSLRGNFSAAAIGATLAMVPMTLILLLACLKIVKNPGEGLASAAIAIQILGCIIWGISMLAAMSKMQKGDTTTFGAKIVAFSVLFSALAFLFAVTAKGSVLGAGGNVDRFLFQSAMAGYGIFAFVFTVNPLMVIGSVLLRRRVSSFSWCVAGYAIISLLPLFYFLTLKSMVNEMDTLLTICVVFLAIGVAFSLLGWWQAVKNSDDETVEGELTVETGTDNTANETSNKVATLEHHSDEALMQMLHDESGKYTLEERNEASMILFNRNSPAFMQELHNESADQLQQIVNNPDPYFDGYVKAARSLLRLQ